MSKIKVRNHNLMRVGDECTFVANVEFVEEFKITKDKEYYGTLFECNPGKWLTAKVKNDAGIEDQHSELFDLLNIDAVTIVVLIEPDVYKSRVLEFYNSRMTKAREVFNNAEAAYKAECAEMLSALGNIAKEQTDAVFIGHRAGKVIVNTRLTDFTCALST